MPPTVIRIRLQQSLEPHRDGNRRWQIEITDGDNTPISGPLVDPWLIKDYTLLTHFVDRSFEPHLYGLSPRANRERLREARVRIPLYHRELIQSLQQIVNSIQGSGQDLLFIIEEERNLPINHSLHVITWELLEDILAWSDDAISRPSNVSVIRVLCPKNCPITKELRHCFTPHKPVRILLVIGRDLSKEDTLWEERITPGLIQRPLMQIIQHLNEIGHHRQVELEILRPSTLDQLKNFLDAAPKDHFDIVHLDMHGERIQGSVHLRFSVPEGEPWSSASEIAKILCPRAKLLVMNACNVSDIHGGPGVPMVREFLRDEVNFISSTNFRVLAPAAEIYYPTFYMSLLLHESFHDAATVARAQLRAKTLRFNGQYRKDHFVQSVYSNSLARHILALPSPSCLLRYRAVVEAVCIRLHRLLRHFAPNESTQIRTCNYKRLNENFNDVPSHVSEARGIDLPRIALPILEIEFWLRTNPRKTVYLYPDDPESVVMQQNTRFLIRNMARVWIRTNFVTEVHIISTRALLQLPAFLIPFNWAFNSQGHTTFWRERKDRDRRPPQVKRMLVIEEIDLLDPAPGRAEISSAQEAAFERITQIFLNIEAIDNDLYLIMMGAKGVDEWNLGREDWPELGMRWSGAKEILVLQDKTVKLATFRRKRMG